MKNILLGVFIVLSLQSFAQGEFRGMRWGTTSSQLKSSYPDAQWESESEGNFKVFMTDDNVGGLKVKVVYTFTDDKLNIGAYYFNEIHTSDNLYYDDFISISTILNKKYDMEMTKNWNNTTWKNNPNYIGHALKSGHVEMSEVYEGEFTKIAHSISSENDIGITHMLIYADAAFIKKQNASENKDF